MVESSLFSANKQLSDWLDKQPRWYSFALHLAARGSYGAQDVEDLAAAVCLEQGFALPLGNASRLVEFESWDIASPEGSAREVVLERITAEHDVNALVAGASITFAREGLTIVYGANGSGKSGFSRLIRNVSTSRAGSAAILSNVFEEQRYPAATYEATIDGQRQAFTLDSSGVGAGAGEHALLPEIMYFDAACATAEIRSKKNDVLYVPPVLEVLERLSSLVGEVSKYLQAYADELPVAVQEAAVPAEIRQAPLVEALLECAEPIESRALLAQSVPTDEDLQRLERLPKLIESDPDIEIPKLEAQLAELSNLRNALLEVYRVCDARFAATHMQAIEEVSAAQAALDALRAGLSESCALDGVGTDVWKTLWTAARDYSTTLAYPEAPFPVTGEGARCPLCQQPLSEDAKARMSTFDVFMEGAAQKNLEDKLDALAQVDEAFSSVLASIQTVRSTASFLNDRETTAQINLLFDGIAELDGYPDEAERAQIQESITRMGRKVREELDALSREVDDLRAQAQPGTIDRYQAELATLRARKWATENAEALIADAETRRMKSLIADARRACSTTQISRLVKTISQTEVVERLQIGFSNELAALRASTQPIYLKARTQSGREYQELTLDGAVGKVASGDVLSEGEQKMAALAGFFALLDMSGSRSTVVFDDPVTSLDHLWVESSAERIAKEALKRPVIVFTHDPRFCSLLARFARGLAVPMEFRTVSRRGRIAGIVRNEPDWISAGTDEMLRQLAADADALAARVRNDEFADNGEFEREIGSMYGKLRATWERAVEEVLLEGAVERGAFAVHTQSLRSLTDIEIGDFDIVDAGVSKCAEIAEACSDPVEPPEITPGVAELKTDIAQLEVWVRNIRTRRANGATPS